MNTKLILGAFALLSISLLSRLAGAQSSADGAAAQALFDQARVLMTDGRAAEACPKLEESQRLDPKSGTLLNLARCYEESGKLASAWTKYLEAAPAARAAGNPEREAVARERAAALAPRLAKMVVEVDPKLNGLAGLEIRKDGVLMGIAQWGLELPADEGTHKLLAQAPGYKPWEGSIVVKGEATITRALVPMLEVDPTADIGASDVGGRVNVGKPRGLGPQRIAAITAGGIGVLGLGGGAFFGLKARSKKSTADKYCTGSDCTSQVGVDAGDDARSAGSISTVLVAVGAAGVATGVILWFSDPGSDGREGAAVSVGLGSIELKGTW